MRKVILALATAAILGAVPALAQGEGVAAGAATGAIVGGIVGGPVGAAVGAGVGATAGAASEASAPSGGVVVESAPTSGVRERNTTCVQGSGSTTCTETEVRR